MKQFIKNQKVTYNLMSFTGYKALLIFNLLTESPKSYEEIKNYIYNHPYLREQISMDTMRVYMNSLKRLGCEIKRIKGEDKVSRYFISSHPFELQLSQDEKNSISSVYKNIVKSLSVEELLSMDNFFEKLGKYVKDDEFVVSLRKHSPLKEINKSVLKDLVDYCKRKDQIVISYNSPNSGVKQIEVISDKLDVSNGKIYLYGTGFEYNQYGSFLVSRIKSIDGIKIGKSIPNGLQELKIKYELACSPKDILLQENEKILDTAGDKLTVEATISNEFLAIQRILEFGPKCKVVAPDDFREKVVTILKDMKAGYYCG